ncbi:SH3 domain-containing protein [Eubacteriales bacterium OttesenSCG-928-A19]|nr:SH3 domain-containing protein [Eubacteriales bacterium OttesenSCG-928-A19]
MGVSATDFANLAVEKAQRVPPIPYVLGGRTGAGTDCSNLIWLLMQELGGKVVRAGSNTIWASHVTNKVFRNDGGALQFGGELTPGMLLFIDYNDVVTQTPEGTPGKMDHMGIYVGNVPGLLTPDGKQGNVIHASQSRGMVCASTLLNAWTHGAFLNGVDYGGGISEPDDQEPEQPSAPGEQTPGSSEVEELTPNAPILMPGPGEAKVITKETGLLLRKQPKKDAAVIKEIPKGAIVKVITYDGTAWTKVRWVASDGIPHEGFVATQYLYFYEG